MSDGSMICMCLLHQTEKITRKEPCLFYSVEILLSLSKSLACSRYLIKWKWIKEWINKWEHRRQIHGAVLRPPPKNLKRSLKLQLPSSRWTVHIRQGSVWKDRSQIFYKAAKMKGKRRQMDEEGVSWVWWQLPVQWFVEFPCVEKRAK